MAFLGDGRRGGKGCGSRGAAAQQGAAVYRTG